MPVTRLRPCVCAVQVVQRHVLHNLLALVHVALGQRHVLLGLKVELGRIRVAAAHTAHRAAVGLDVDDVANLRARGSQWVSEVPEGAVAVTQHFCGMQDDGIYARFKSPRRACEPHACEAAAAALHGPPPTWTFSLVSAS